VAKTSDDLQDVQVIREGLTFRRHFSTEGKHPFDEIEWETRDAVIPNFKEGGNAFEQRNVEFPVSWSQNATNIVAQKYFRGPLGTPQREHSVRQMVDRVAGTITRWGVEDGYFAAPPRPSSAHSAIAPKVAVPMPPSVKPPNFSV